LKFSQFEVSASVGAGGQYGEYSLQIKNKKKKM